MLNTFTIVIYPRVNKVSYFKCHLHKNKHCVHRILQRTKVKPKNPDNPTVPSYNH